MKHFMLCLATGFALVLSGCGDNDNVNNNAHENIGPGDVEEGDVPVGKEVTLKGKVTKVYDAHTFKLDDPGFDFDDDLVVVTKEPLPFKAEDDATVEATGRVEKFSVIEVEKGYGWDFNPEVKAELEKVEYYLANAKVTVLKPADE